MQIERRQFITGGAIAGLGVLATGLAACSPSKAATKESESQTQQASTYEPGDIAETIDCDICIVGGGMSGLAAACQAGENGDNVLVVEAGGSCGGAGNGVEGLFGCNSPLQKELGIELDKAAVLEEEVTGTNYTNSGLHWKDLMNNSGENIAWLIEQGVEFSGKVDGYMPAGKFLGYHWFKNGHAREGYVPQMTARAEALGVQIRTLTTALHLIMEDDACKGLYAENSNGKTIQVNAKAVILAAGGFIGNEDLLQQQMFIAPGEMTKACLSTAETLHRMGGGMNMALEVGAKNYPGTCIEGWHQPANLPVGDASMTFSTMFSDTVSARDVLLSSGFNGWPACIWVQEDAQRFANEAESITEPERTFSVRKFYKEHYQIMDQSMIDTIFADASLKEAFENMMEEYEGSVMKADTIEALAKLVDLDASALKTTVDEYNGYCAAGKDEDFNKPAEYLVPIAQAPFYIFRCEICGDATLGGICVDRNFRALTPAKVAIPGLYMAGVDACMLYNCVYPIAIGGTACQNSVNSGRTAANHAHSYIA